MQLTKRLIDIRLTNELLLQIPDAISIKESSLLPTSPVILGKISAYTTESNELCTYVISCNSTQPDTTGLILKSELSAYAKPETLSQYATSNSVSSITYDSDVLTLQELSVLSALMSLTIPSDVDDPNLSTNMIDAFTRLYATKPLLIDTDCALYQWFTGLLVPREAGNSLINYQTIESKSSTAYSAINAIAGKKVKLNQLSDYISLDEYRLLELKVSNLESILNSRGIEYLGKLIPGDLLIQFTFTSADVLHNMTLDLSKCIISGINAVLQLPDGEEVDLSSGNVPTEYLTQTGVYTIDADHALLPLSAVSVTRDGSPILYVNEDNLPVELSVVRNDGNLDLILKYGYRIFFNDGRYGYVIGQLEGKDQVIGFTDDQLTDDAEICAISIPAAATSVPPRILEDISGLQQVIMYGCGNLSSIGDGAFSGCDSLREVIIPDGVIEIGDDAFSDCANIEYIFIPSSVLRIGSNAFDSISDTCIIEVEDLTIQIDSIDELRDALNDKYSSATDGIEEDLANSLLRLESEKLVPGDADSCLIMTFDD